MAEAVRAIERRHLGSGRARPAPGWSAAPIPLWRLGVDVIDHRLGPHGLDAASLHEIKPSLAGPEVPGHGGSGALASDWTSAVAAALAFALALALCRRGASAEARAQAGRILWCWPASLAHEVGHLYAPGLMDFGLDPARLIIAVPERAGDVLWAMEEGLNCADLALVVGALHEVPLTPARRLALAAGAHGVPCLMVTHPRAPPAAATATRWRIGRAESAPHPLQDALIEPLPGAPRWRVLLETCRRGRSGLGVSGPMSVPLLLEWSHAALRFHLAAEPADRASREDRSRRRAERQAAGAGGRGEPR